MGAIRFSLGRGTTEEAIQAVVEDTEQVLSWQKSFTKVPTRETPNRRALIYFRRNCWLRIAGESCAISRTV